MNGQRPMTISDLKSLLSEAMMEYSVNLLTWPVHYVKIRFAIHVPDSVYFPFLRLFPIKKV